jgi:hypothetical protein
MGLVGVVDRLGVGSPSSKAAALFGFDDALVIVPLGIAVRPGFRVSKKTQTALTDVSGAVDLMPEQVKAKWDDSVVLSMSDLQSAELRKSVQGGLFGVRRLHINGTECEAGVLLVHPSVKDSLVSLLTSLLGDRFNDRT